MPAFTLGGTVSGGGNQINNVVIGTTTPLAGSFTTLSATGSVTGLAFKGNSVLDSTGVTGNIWTPTTWNMYVNTSIVASLSSTGLVVTGAATVSTTLGVTGVSTLTGGAVVQGLTVGRGAGAVATNTAVGFQAGSGNTTGNLNSYFGYQAGLTLSTGAANQFFGYNSGSAVTTGAKNVILGSYTGSAAPISATGSNYVVLSDGDGNIRQYFNGSIAIFNGTISPVQATTAGAPAYVKGAMYFDTTLNKLRIGGATGWETVTSV
jgi:hypothetical protein